MKTAYSVKLILAILIVTVIGLAVHTVLVNCNWENQISTNKILIDRVKALEYENDGQWQRISDFEVYFCNPELIKCGKLR